MSLRKAASHYIAEGLCPIAVDDKKRALFSWGKYQKQLPTTDDLNAQFKHDKAYGVALVCGAISGNLEVIDIDQKYDQSGTIFDRFMYNIDDELRSKLYVVKTVSGGYHIYYRCDFIEGNQKLACRPVTDEEKQGNPHLKQLVLIETRGEGGYVIAPPTPGYERLTQFVINVISIDERESLMSAARQLNEVFEQHRPDVRDTNDSINYSCTPWDDYDSRGDVHELLIEHGWEQAGRKSKWTYYTRPGKKDGVSASFNHDNRFFYVFTSSSQFEPDKGYRPSAVHAILEYGGDFKKSAKVLAEAGYGAKLHEIDKPVRKKISAMLAMGKPVDDIVSAIAKDEEITTNEAAKILDKYNENYGPTYLTFWDVTETRRGPQVSLLKYKLEKWLYDEGFHLLFYGNTSTYQVINLTDGIVREATIERIKKHIKNYILNLPAKFDGITPSLLLESIYQGANQYFNQGFFEFLDGLNVNFLKHTEQEAYYPFKNGVVVVSKDGARLIQYKAVDGAMWDTQVIDFNVKVDDMFDYERCEFYRFIRNISGNDDKKARYCMSLIGYMLHRYKDAARPFALILAEDTDDEKKGGGTGKGILAKALGYLTKIDRIDGKNFKLDKSFAFQRVGLDTGIIAIEDVRKNVDFEGFYGMITEGITVEKKHKDEMYIPYVDSPKVMFTTNFTFGAVSNHAKRRQKVFEFHPHYDNKFTPLDDFGHKLFDDWDDDEWDRFYNLMFTCVSYYLEFGIEDYENSERTKAKHIKINFGEDFLDYWQNMMSNGHANWHVLNDEYTSFLTVNNLDKRDYSTKRFKKGITDACEMFERKYEQRRNWQNAGVVEFKIN